jgi:hypothetical protein
MNTDEMQFNFDLSVFIGAPSAADMNFIQVRQFI